MPIQTVLICGAGIAGPVSAYWLSRAGLKCTIVERAPALRSGGQQVDVRGKGLSVVRKMGLEEAIRAKVTDEKGLSFVNEKGKVFASFPVDKEGGRSFSSDTEIIRDKLVGIFYDHSLKHGVDYIFDDFVTALDEREEKIHVTFDRSEMRAFDIVVLADGQGSRTRDLIFPQVEDAVKWLGAYTSYFTIPYKQSDGDFAQVYHAPGRRSILIRPDNAGCSRVFLTVLSDAPHGVLRAGLEKQKEMYRRLFTGAGWETERILDGMDKAGDFYMQSVVQVKYDCWSKGRVVLVGDAGYCASPISGLGTTLAIVGAYNLAGCIKQYPNDHTRAFRQYEEVMRPFVKSAQKLPPGAPGIAHPKTWWGIVIFRSVLAFVSWSGLAALAQRLFLRKSENTEVPDYGF